MSNLRITQKSIFHLTAVLQVSAHPGQTITRKQYAFFTAELVLEGCGWLNIDGRYHDVEAGDMYILPPGHDHEYGADGQNPWKKLFFNAGGTLPVRLIDCYCLNNFHFPAWPEPELFTRMQDLYSNLSDISHREAALLLHRLIAIAAGEQPATEAEQPSAVATALNFIANNLQNHIRLEDIARASFLSPSQLTRLFKAATGCTPYDHLCRQRIEMACHLLRCTDLRLSDIARRLQFADPFYFSNAFKKATGCSPSQYRNQPEPLPD